jgi:hypothetical protein
MRSCCAHGQVSSRLLGSRVLSLGMKFSRGLLTTALAALGIGAGIALAPPASAGCQSATPQDTYCDDPIAPDGTWRRCHQNSGYRQYWGSPWVFGPVVPPTTKCYRVDPSQPWPALPAFQPQYHIDG